MVLITPGASQTKSYTEPFLKTEVVFESKYYNVKDVILLLTKHYISTA